MSQVVTQQLLTAIAPVLSQASPSGIYDMM